MAKPRSTPERTGLSSQMGRPITGPLSTLPAGMRDAIVQMRQTHPGWGPTTLLAELRVDPRWSDHSLPSRSRIAVLLKAAKLTRHYQKLSPLPTPLIRVEGTPMTSGNSTRHQPHARGGRGQRQPDHHD